MIDLHMHTTYSDGTDTVKELLENYLTTKGRKITNSILIYTRKTLLN